MYSDELAPIIQWSNEVISLYLDACLLFEKKDKVNFNIIVQEICNKTKLSPQEVKYHVITKIYPKLDL